MRVVLSSGTRTWGGLEQMCVHLALGLQARGHEVVLFCRSGSPVQERLQAHLACEPILRHGRLNPLTLARCARALRRHRPDVVIGNTTKDPSWTGVAARLLGIPFLYRHEFNRPYYDPPRTRLLFGWVPRLHIVNSEASRSTVLASAPWLKPEQVRVIYNGIDVDQFAGAAPAELGLPADAVVFGFVGRFEEQKGIFEVAEAWPRVVGALPNAHLVLVGWGQLEERMRAALAGAPNVHWLGFRADVPELMNAFDVLVAPFHQEGFGLVLCEAMAAGVPVVAARASSTPELVDNGVEGKLVPLRDADALAREMTLLGSSAELRACLGARGRARVARDFTTERMVLGHERLLEEVVLGARANRAGPVGLTGSGSEAPGGAAGARLAGHGAPRTG
jgi:glycosyltransferase involved in cell wall biosynthesis